MQNDRLKILRKFIHIQSAFLAWSVVACFASDIPSKNFKMENLWNVDMEQEAFLFGEIEDLLIDQDGTLYVLDSLVANVKVFSSKGRYLRTIGREGDGPGETRAPGDIEFMSDGTLAFVSKLNWKIATIDKPEFKS